MGKLQSQLDCLVFEIKKNYSGFYFYPLRSRAAKVDKPHENEAKTRGSDMEHG